jgi:hypothetical protein
MGWSHSYLSGRYKGDGGGEGEGGQQGIQWGGATARRQCS